MAYHNSAVRDVVERVQVMIDAFWQKYGHPYAHFFREQLKSTQRTQSPGFGKGYDSLCHYVAIRISLS